MVASDTKIIDGRDHLYGRLCSIVAKELLAGQKIVIVRCDEMCISGSRESLSIVPSIVTSAFALLTALILFDMQ
jgi:ribosomal protein L13